MGFISVWKINVIFQLQCDQCVRQSASPMERAMARVLKDVDRTDTGVDANKDKNSTQRNYKTSTFKVPSVVRNILKTDFDAEI